jgi:hypothetical protein
MSPRVQPPGNSNIEGWDEGGGIPWTNKLDTVDTKAKCRHQKYFTCKETFWQVFICLRPPPLLEFCLGWSTNFVGSKSGQIQSFKLLHGYGLLQDSTLHPSPSHTL